MKVFKFGGASVGKADGVRNLLEIIKKFGGKDLIVIVSAMGKTTNHLEKVLECKQDKLQLEVLIQKFVDYHKAICRDLLESDKKTEERVEEYAQLLSTFAQKEYPNSRQQYDAIVSVGELISTEIVAEYLNKAGLESYWLDAREVIKTSDDYSEGKVIWDLTQIKIDKKIRSIPDSKIVVTQGFIGSTTAGITTTLGREGSDFSAAIFSGCLDAESMTVWKDVPGILNADPKLMDNTRKYMSLSYQEASEMTYYGVKAIHPKTIKPLANKNIPLYVKSFVNPDHEGTLINSESLEPHGPAVIFKFDQCLLTFQVRDFTFINERHLSHVFQAVDQLNIRINLMQNSAISISICVDNEQDKIDKLIEKMSEYFKIIYNDDLQLVTVKNYDIDSVENISKGKEILLEQRTRQNYQIVVKGNLEKPAKDTLNS